MSSIKGHCSQCNKEIDLLTCIIGIDKGVNYFFCNQLCLKLFVDNMEDIV